MNLLDYIQGERRGKKAHELEQESMHDPFLSDAIDGYDALKDNPVFHLKTLQKQIAKRSRKKWRRIQLWNIAVGVLAVICIGAIFFLKENRLEEIPYVENQMQTPQIEEIQNQIQESPAVEDTIVIIQEVEKEVEKEVEVIANNARKKEQEKKVIPREKVNHFSQTEDIQAYFRGKPKNATLTNAEIQAIFSGENQGNAVNKADESIYQTPQPATGESAYKEYLEKNRKPAGESASKSQHGKVILLFQVNEKGRPVKITVLRSLSQAADNEAIRLLQNGPDWTIGEKNARLEILF
jgi:outer membrane biosynthesis protein TonB